MSRRCPPGGGQRRENACEHFTKLSEIRLFIRPSIIVIAGVILLDIIPITEDGFRQSNFLSGIAEFQATDILNQGNRVCLQSGEILFRQDEPAYRS